MENSLCPVKGFCNGKNPPDFADGTGQNKRFSNLVFMKALNQIHVLSGTEADLGAGAFFTQPSRTVFSTGRGGRKMIGHFSKADSVSAHEFSRTKAIVFLIH